MKYIYMFETTLGQFNDWVKPFNHTFIPNERQRPILEATEHALNEGLFYSSDVKKRAAELLGVPLDSEWMKANKQFNVEGGVFGYDVYHAREVIEKTKYYNEQSEYMRALSLEIGQKLGTYKKQFEKDKKNIVITELLETGAVIQFTRGNRRYQQTVNGQYLKEIIDSKTK